MWKNTRNVFYKTSAVRTERKAHHDPYGSKGSLNLLTPLTIINEDIFEVSLMRCNIRSVNYTLQSVKALDDPYGSNGSLSLLTPLTIKDEDIFSVLSLNLPNEM